MPPVLTAQQELQAVVLTRTATVLFGTATDGGSVAKVSARVQPPVGDEFRADVDRTGDSWRYDFTGQEIGQYQIWVEAEDEAGNRTSAGPFPVEVTCTDAGAARDAT